MTQQPSEHDHHCCRPQSRKTFRRFWMVAMSFVLVAGSAVYAYVQFMRSLPPQRNECVILLHGLYRSAASMAVIEHRLILDGYGVINIDYASTRSAISSVAEGEVASAVATAKEQGYERIHFVSHSLGALVVRTYLQNHRLPQGSRIVLLAPPNQGSELADWAHKTFPRLIQMSGPAVWNLGTRDQPYTSTLKPISEEVGIIIGEESWNPLFSKILPGRDDGAVTIERAKLEEMKDFLVAPCNHTTILLNPDIREQVLHFLEKGRFDRRRDMRSARQ